MDIQTLLSRFKIKSLNSMQQAAMNAIGQPGDVTLVSPTGTGKTLAFLLPLLNLLETRSEAIQALIIVPSRELALQIEKVFKQMGTIHKINSCYGGHSVRIEENNFSSPPAILVGTPGRIAHHLRRKNFSTGNIHTLVLDEFDKSLELGFKDEMEYIITQCHHLRKRILTSATGLDEIPAFVGVKKSAELNFTTEHKELKSELEVKSVKVQGDDKLEALLLLVGKTGNEPTIVFCNHREAVDRISKQLQELQFDHGFYHGGLDQAEREKTLIKFRNGSVTLLISTDLAARGLDIPEVKNIIHYQLPASEDIMIHRNGRTARMHATGTAYFLLDRNDRLPAFLPVKPDEETLPKKLVLPPPAPWKTIYIAAGKKDKINKADVVGMLLQKGQLSKEELGRVDILDHSAYAAVKAGKINKTLQLVRNEKIKNKKIKMEIAT
jgi:superfamily II DNA/RNA helicase